MTEVGILFRCWQTALLVGTIASVAAVAPAHADSFTFNFNSLSSGASSSAIATYMSGIIGCSNCVQVTGAVADQTYNGEGYVTGPGTSGKAAHSLTLGTSDGATASNSNSALDMAQGGRLLYDTFIATTNDSSHQVSTEITIKITGGYSLSGILSFDYEIFPDAAGNPDFTFDAYNSSHTLLTTWTQLGVIPGTTDGNATRSPNSSHETNKQYIGTWSSVTALNNVTELDFIDWPATIAVDNLKVASSVPEPGAVVLLGTLMAAFLWKFARKGHTA